MAKFDQMFLTMVQESGGLNPFLDSMFSFLQRRTDFFYEAEPGDKMGFPPGYSEQLVSRYLLISVWPTWLNQDALTLLLTLDRLSGSTKSTRPSMRSDSHRRARP